MQGLTCGACGSFYKFQCGAEWWVESLPTEKFEPRKPRLETWGGAFAERPTGKAQKIDYSYCHYLITFRCCTSLICVLLHRFQAKSNSNNSVLMLVPISNFSSPLICTPSPALSSSPCKVAIPSAICNQA